MGSDDRASTQDVSARSTEQTRSPHPLFSVVYSFVSGKCLRKTTWCLVACCLLVFILENSVANRKTNDKNLPPKGDVCLFGVAIRRLDYFCDWLILIQH